MKSLKEILKERPVFGAGVFTMSTIHIAIFAQLGLDFLMFDIEHTPMAITDAKVMLRTCIANGLHPIVRVSSHDEVEIRKAYEMGAEGVIVPHIRTKEDIQKAVAAARFPTYPGGENRYNGTRSYDSNVPAAKYGGRGYDPVQYLDECDRSQMLIAMCEDIQFIENIDEIFSVPGFDAVIFGAFDFGMSEHRADFHKPDIRKREDLNHAFSCLTAKAAEKGIEVFEPLFRTPEVEDIAQAIRAGRRVIRFSFDTHIVQGAMAEHKANIIDRFRK